MASQLKAPGTFYYYLLRNNDNDNVSLQERYVVQDVLYSNINRKSLVHTVNILSRDKIYATSIMHVIFYGTFYKLTRL
jgi:hypothetical protein